MTATAQRRPAARKKCASARKNPRNAKPNAQERLKAQPTMRSQNKDRSMTNAESKTLKKGSRVYWQGDITETSWDAVTIAWDNGQVARVHHGDMREIRQ